MLYSCINSIILSKSFRSEDANTLYFPVLPNTILGGVGGGGGGSEGVCVWGGGGGEGG